MTVLPGMPPDPKAPCERECDEGFIDAGDNSVYPCPRCRPQLFAKWAGGHTLPNHDAAACADCRASASTAVPRTTEPRRAVL